MFEISDLIYKILTEATGVNAIVGLNVFPIIADQKTQTPFIVYELEELPRYSKGSDYEYLITVNGVEETPTKAFILSDAIKTAMENANEVFKYEGAQTHYQNEKELIIKQRYKIKYFLTPETVTPPEAPTELGLIEGQI